MTLLCHLFIMVRLGNDSSNGDDYLMPALFNPRLDKWYVVIRNWFSLFP